jgi:phosphoenolpyruvate carboxykinase (ATP)
LDGLEISGVTGLICHLPGWMFLRMRQRSDVRPFATFSPSFGGPFMALNPTVYGELLRGKIATYNVTCWLVNTGWSGGAYGVGSRIKIADSRALVNAALDGNLNAGTFEKDTFFGLEIPKNCDGVPPEVLNPRNTWGDKGLYDKTAAKLVAMFKDNFNKFASLVSKDVGTVL